jgi:hypothetical protein
VENDIAAKVISTFNVRYISLALTLELSGGEAVRLERVVRRLNYLHLTVFIAPAVQGRL